MDPAAEQALAYMAVMIVLIVPAWRIFTRAGLQPALSLLIFVPYLGILIAALVLALRRWPGLEDEE